MKPALAFLRLYLVFTALFEVPALYAFFIRGSSAADVVSFLDNVTSAEGTRAVSSFFLVLVATRLATAASVETGALQFLCAAVHFIELFWFGREAFVFGSTPFSAEYFAPEHLVPKWTLFFVVLQPFFMALVFLTSRGGKAKAKGKKQ